MTNQDFDAIAFAGKCGTLLSAISAETQEKLTDNKVSALAKANKISSRTEMPAILAELERQKLILPGIGGYEVLGLGGQAILEHTSTIFVESPREQHEDAVLEVSEISSESLQTEKTISEYISDRFKLIKKTLQMHCN